MITLNPTQVCMAIKEVANRLVGKDAESLFADMGKTWDYMTADPQLRWCVCVSNVMRLLSIRPGLAQRKVLSISQLEQ